MGFTRSQCKSLGIEHLFPSPRSDETIIRELAGEQVPLPAKEAGDGMNKTERAFFEEMQASPAVVKILREPYKLRLAGRTFYAPDFVVWPVVYTGDCRPACVEVKGWMREDAAVKLKVAAALYAAEWRWLLVTRAGRHGWEVREVGRGGIGWKPVNVPWINGGGE